MKDNQKKYLDKVVEFIVRDTKIDYDQKRIQYPFYTSYRFFESLTSSYSFFSTFSSFSKYCIDVYGLTEDEVKYVWDKYRTIILDKISNK